MLETRTMGHDGAAIVGRLGPRKRATTQQLKRSASDLFVVDGDRVCEVRWVFWTARGWQRLGYEQSEPGAWSVTPIGPMVLAIKVTL